MQHAEAVQSLSRCNVGWDEMQRDMDLVRSILVKIDEADKPLRLSDLLDAEATDDDYGKVDYHLQMLVDQIGFVSGVAAHTYSGKNWINLNLTWTGHEFLDSVRDPEIWKQTKAGAVKVGNWSIKTLADVAVAIAKSRVEQLFSSGSLDI